MMSDHHSADRSQSTKGLAGILSTEEISLQELAYLLACEGVGTSRAILVEESDLSGEAGGGAMLAGLRTLQGDPSTEVIVALCKAPPREIAQRLLARVQESDRPTVLCFVGGDPRLAWRAGAIPAVRLDEAALRAAAWVRGWDQALITSRLEEQDEELGVLARELRPRTLRLEANQGRRQLAGFFGSELARHEAQAMLADVLGGSGKDRGAISDVEKGTPNSMHVVPDPSLRWRDLRDALADSQVAAILLDVIQRQLSGSEQVNDLIDSLAGTNALIIAHVGSTGTTSEHLADLESKLRRAGVVVATSNAAAARLAGMVIRP